MATIVLDQVQSLLPDVRFVPGKVFCWSPQTQCVHYAADTLDQESGIWALLHEASHALLGHQTYNTDFELLTLEVKAWQKAQMLGAELGIIINKDHIEDCLDTYREWLHRRSTCPTCGSVSLQHSPTTYACHNCPARWQVTPSRFCRPYRKLQAGQTQSLPLLQSARTFS